jgi:hypothetical protein
MKPIVSKGATPPWEAGIFAGSGGMAGVWADAAIAGNNNSSAIAKEGIANAGNPEVLSRFVFNCSYRPIR